MIEMAPKTKKTVGKELEGDWMEHLREHLILLTWFCRCIKGKTVASLGEKVGQIVHLNKRIQ